MGTRSGEKVGRKKTPQVKPQQVGGAKYLRIVRDLLAPLRSHRDCANRELHYDEYVQYVLLHFFTPVVTSMRGLQQVSDFDRVHRKLNLPRFSLGAFSEAGGRFDPELLKPVIKALGAQLSPTHPDPRLASLDRTPMAVDGSLIDAVPSMAWALWLDEEHRAAKLHLEFDLLKQAPADATVTHGNGDERTVLRENLSAGKLYVTDRGYADYGLLAEILDAGSSFVSRLRHDAAYEVLEERALSASARKAGIEQDVIVKLGSDSAPELHDTKIRLIRIHVHDTDARPGRPNSNKGLRKPNGDYTILLATDQLDLDVELVAALYRYRWQIELFFRWLKKILDIEHLLSRNHNGLTIMLYCALIASLLIALWTGRKPSKRAYELICFYFLGWIGEAELAAHLDRLSPAVD